MGRPVKYTPELKAEIVALIKEYTEKTEIPILKEFLYLNHIPHSSIYAYDEFLEPAAELICKKEAQLERLALTNEINTSMARFSLFQLGWSERQQLESVVSKSDRVFEWADEPTHPFSRGDSDV